VGEEVGQVPAVGVRGVPGVAGQELLSELVGPGSVITVRPGEVENDPIVPVMGSREGHGGQRLRFGFGHYTSPGA